MIQNLEYFKKIDQEMNDKRRKSFENWVNLKIKQQEILSEGINTCLSVFQQWGNKKCNKGIETRLGHEKKIKEISYNLKKGSYGKFTLEISQYKEKTYFSESKKTWVNDGSYTVYIPVIMTEDERVDQEKTLSHIKEKEANAKKAILEYRQMFLLYDNSQAAWLDLEKVIKNYQESFPAGLRGIIKTEGIEW